MASKMSYKKCSYCQITGSVTRFCIICSETFCFECAVKFDPKITTRDGFEKILYYVCRRKCMDKYEESLKVTPEQIEENPEEKCEKSPGVRRFLENGGKPGPSQSPTEARNDKQKQGASFEYHSKSCPRCFHLQPDFRICRKCDSLFYYYCEDECWNIKDEFDAHGKKKPKEWLCHWCESGSSSPVCFRSDKKRFIRLAQDFMAPLDTLVDTDPVFANPMVEDHVDPAQKDLITWITVKPPRHLLDADLSYVSQTFDVVTSAEVTEALMEEEMITFLKQMRKTQDDAKARDEKEKLDDVIAAGSSDDLLKVVEVELEKKCGYESTSPRLHQYSSASPKMKTIDEATATDDEENTSPFKPLTPEQQALLDDALIDLGSDVAVKNEETKEVSVEERLESIRRDIEDIEIITRAKIAKEEDNTPSGVQNSKSGIDKAMVASETTVKDRIEAAQRAIVAFCETTRQMKETTIEDIRVSLDGKVKCLLKIWEDIGKKK